MESEGHSAGSISPARKVEECDEVQSTGSWFVLIAVGPSMSNEIVDIGAWAIGHCAGHAR